MRYETNEPFGVLQRLRTTAALKHEEPYEGRLEILRWTPNRRVYRGLPSQLRFDVAVFRNRDGRRIVFPATPIRAFLVTTATGGMAIDQHGRQTLETAREHLTDIHFLWFFEWSFVRALTLSRSFNRMQDLQLVGRAAGELGRADILPEVWLPGSPQAARITPHDLIEAGRAHAADRRRHCDGVHSAVVEGLLYFAEQLCPEASANGAEVSESTLKYAIFGHRDVADPDLDVQREVLRRLIDAIQMKSDRSPANFRRWLFDDFNNLIQQLARKKPRIPCQVVRAVLVERIWDSYSAVSRHVTWQMLAVMDVMELDAVEQTMFLNRYSPTTAIGDISPVVLHNRAEFVDRILLDDQLATDDDTRPWRVLQIALVWYASMVADRRRADGAEKRPAHFILPFDATTDESSFTPRSESADVFREIDERLDSAGT